MFNVTRSPNSPASLAFRRSYTEADVLEELKEIFHDKCYLCEVKEPTSLNVEHFHPHQGNDEKKYDWNNLYYVCGRCNNIKLARYNNLIDCADPDYDAFKLVKHLPPHTPYQNRLVIESMADDDKTRETAELLDEIYNTDKTINKKITGEYLRKKIFNKYNRFLELVNTYIDDELPQEEKDNALMRLRSLVSKKQEFSAFIRWIVLEDNFLFGILGEHID